MSDKKLRRRLKLLLGSLSAAQEDIAYLNREIESLYAKLQEIEKRPPVVMQIEPAFKPPYVVTNTGKPYTITWSGINIPVEFPQKIACGDSNGQPALL